MYINTFRYFIGKVREKNYHFLVVFMHDRKLLKILYITSCYTSN
jgi:hypothetical protein